MENITVENKFLSSTLELAKREIVGHRSNPV